MINPTECAERIVLNDDVAKELFDLLLWAADQPDLKDNNEYDVIMGKLYLRMQAGRDAREAYAKGRLHRVELQIADVATGSN